MATIATFTFYSGTINRIIITYCCILQNTAVQTIS